MSRRLYPYYLSIGDRNLVLLWAQADAGDVFHTLPDGALFIGNDKKGVKRKLGEEAADIQWDQSAELNLDEFWKKLASLQVNRASSAQTCIVLNRGWNFFDDLLRTFSRRAALKKSKSPVLEAAYKKIFLGCNLKAVSQAGDAYHPQWKAKEITALKEYFSTARQAVEKRIPLD